VGQYAIEQMTSERAAPWPSIAMTAFTDARDLDHPVSAEVEQTIRDVLQELLSSQGLEGMLVNPGLDPNLLSQSTLAVHRALWAIGERRFPHLRYAFHDDQRMLGTEHW
jgi:hypothetical protein